MHPEAVDARVFRVAPVGQDPKLHDLICGHLGGLSGEEGFNVTGSLDMSPTEGARGARCLPLEAQKKKKTHISKVYISWNKVSRPKALGDFRVLGATTHEPALGPYVNSLSTKDQHSSSETDEFIPSHG